ncbi:MAG TPA: hypothetical protein VMB73_04365 [Acetobacteraceae bacterium]|nr:hypothetical protein [Acetobacteraceae bacterium]
MVCSRITVRLLILPSVLTGMSTSSWAQPQVEQNQHQTPDYTADVPVAAAPPPPPAAGLPQDSSNVPRAADLSFRELLGRLNGMPGNQYRRGFTTPETTTPTGAGGANAGQ